MALSNFERMIRLAEEAFDARNDPDQLQVNQQAIEKLELLHSSTLSEYDDGNGPAVWILLIPTTQPLMEKFLAGKIGEQQLLDQTSAGSVFDAIYLCSAMTLPEHRNKGIAKRLAIGAIENIRKSNPVKQLFVWPFSPEGKELAGRIASEVGLPLLLRDQK